LGRFVGVSIFGMRACHQWSMHKGVTDELIFVMAITPIPLCHGALDSALVDDDVAQATEIAEVENVVR
jgi:hypothetical protein